MYTPAAFAETDSAQIEALCAAHPLAALIAATPAGLVVNHIPLLRAGEGFVGHIALANDLHRQVTPQTPVVAVFQAAQGYVSPNWYPSKAETHRAVPTWNYQVVHVHGHLAFSHAEADKRHAVSLLTRAHERRVNGPEGWRMGDAPADYMAGMLGAIVAFRLHITRIEAKSKLNQNRSAADVAGVIAGLDTQGDAGAGLAEAMRADLARRS